MTGVDVQQGAAAKGGLVHAVARALPLPAGAGMARMMIERNFRAFRHAWITIVSGLYMSR